ncbi:MAG: argininosuccinate lyase, partial [Clostridia bacterium]|nr:argininosuccinate lyase [Clostridia bacterium]
MAKLWAGRTDGNTSELADEFNSSFGFDRKLYKEDITGSIAHAAMLGKTGILEMSEVEAIQAGLKGILSDIEEGKLSFDVPAEDIHMFIEDELTRRIGDAGKRLHTARSRNDQVALDFRMWTRSELETLRSLALDVIAAIVDKAGGEKATILPGYPHRQRA